MKKCVQSFKTVDAITYVYIQRNDGSKHTLILDTKNWLWIQPFSIRILKHGNTFCAKVHDADGKDWLIHRAIINPPNNVLVDHEDGNGLNNLESNLRQCDTAENGQNRQVNKNSTTGVTGVSYVKAQKMYKAYAKLRGKPYFLGLHNTITEAAEAVRLFKEKLMPFTNPTRI